MTRGPKAGGIVLLYIPLFLGWFFWLEGRRGIPEQVIYSPLDDLIPFHEAFIIPYLLWFPYLLGFIGFIVAKDRWGPEFQRMAFMLILGLTTCMLIYTFWPNTQLLRPEVYPRTNPLTDMVRALQGFDTPSNVCPSMHVYSSIVVNHCAWASRHLNRWPWVRWASAVLLVLISASTVFLKQHSILDVIWAAALYAVVIALMAAAKAWHRRRRPVQG